MRYSALEYYDPRITDSQNLKFREGKSIIMNKKMTRKLAAGLAAIAMLTTAMPVSSLTALAAPGEVFTSNFDNGMGDWSMYKEPKGDATLKADGGKLALNIKSVGDKNYAVQMGLGLIPLYKNAKYRLSYEISCTTERYVEGMIQQNGGTYQAYVWDGLNVGPTAQKVEHEFTMKEDNDLMAKLVFNCGLQENDPANLPAHTIYLDNVKLECLDDSAADKTIAGAKTASIMTNQIGYKPNSQKIAVFRGVTNQTEFTVADASTKKVVYTGKLSAKMGNSGAGEDDWQGDFSSVKETGKYIITCTGLEDSYPFEISANPYSDLFDDSVKMLALQRCGEAVSGGKFSHPACHTSLATIYGTNQKIDVTGGWHDAGDYGRYVVAGAKAVGDLLYAYLANPNKAILDETKYELDWMLKMQADNGGVYHKVTCESFPGFVMPEDETAELIVTPISSTATADFCASMALAAQAYKTADSAYAAKCLAAAEKAWKYLEANPNFNFSNPSGVTTGEYGDKTDKDERYWAACQLYVTTGEAKYLQAAESIGTKDGLDWATVGDYGNIALLTNPKADKSSSAYTKAKSTVISEADTFVSNSSKNPYGVALTKFDWGSNMTVANAGIICGLAYQLTGEAKYLNAAEAQLNYLLGSNPLSTCFVTGYGTVSPKNPHHRPSVKQGEAMKGMLVGGVNSALEDDAAKAYLKEAAPYKCWIDNADSYSTNEITIYWNSPLTYLLTITDTNGSTTPSQDPTQPATQPTTKPAGDVVYGDANGDGKVDILDVIRMNRFLLGTADLNDKQRKNADVDLNGVTDSQDSLYILKYVVESIKSLPVNGTNPVQPTEPTTKANDPTSTIKDYGTPMDANATMVSDFRTGKGGDFFASDGWTNGSCFDCWWHKSNTSLDGGKLTLTIDKDKNDKGMYSGAEYRTNKFYHYGYYETSMQAIKNDGVVSSFFTYTGPSDKINDVENPWDEIDIEILGKDTTKVQFNYYTNSKGQHEYMYDLGFDASEGYHTYGFDWQPDHIDWYVDGKKVYSANQNIPSTPGKIMMNTWPGVSDPSNKDNVIDWLKKYDGTTPLSAHYQWATYKQADGAKNPRTLEEIEAEQAKQDPKPTEAPIQQPSTSSIKDYGTPMNANAKMVSDFRTGKGGDFFASDGWTNGSVFDCWWHKSNTSLDGGMLTLTIDQDKGGKGMYSGAEYRTNNFYSYGYYEVSMQAIKNDGVVSSFFTYTGPSDKINGVENPWDEIDIEILGKDTTKVQLNYYTNGKGGHEYMYDLGFDASEGFHTYGFDWQPDHITWYVDGKEAYTMRGDVPKTAGKIMMNAWPGVSDPSKDPNTIAWLKPFNGKTPLSAHYQWATYNPSK